MIDIVFFSKNYLYMSRVRIRPKLIDLTFGSRDQAEQYMQNHPLYGKSRLKFWVDTSTDGLFHIYCEGFISLTESEVTILNEPYYNLGADV